MTAAILCIGTELTRGEIHNTNETWLADRLTALGIVVRCSEMVADEPSDIKESLGRLGRENEIIVCTGGLGPTTDDLTAQTVADLLAVPLQRDAPSLDAITRRVEGHGYKMTASNAKQADFPAGATVLPNPEGTAPGFAVSIGRARAFFMPGVPREMHVMFDNHVLPAASQLVGDAVHQCRVNVFGLPEAKLNDALAGVEEHFGVTVGYRAHFPEIHVKLLARGNTPSGTAQERAERAAARVQELIGDHVFSTGNVSFEEATIECLRRRGWKLALAESCTGGLVAHLLTKHSVSDIFLGGAVTYANQAKASLLGVSEAILNTHGAVSPPVAREMAQGALRHFGADVALAITGIAGPTGGTPEKPVGLVHLAVATRSGTDLLELRSRFDRQRTQLLAAYRGFEMLRTAAEREPTT